MIFNRNKDAIIWKAKQLKLKKTPETVALCKTNNKKYHINENYFNEYSSTMFYVLGFWCADGCITSVKGKNKAFDIHINIKDIELLKNILKDMDSNHKIYTYDTSCKITIVNNKIYDSLTNLGFTERKSLILKFPEWIPEKYLNHFIRGYFDGDGSVAQYGYSVHIIGTIEFLKTLKRNLEINGISVHSIVQSNKGSNRSDIPHTLWITKKEEVRKFYNYIYGNLSNNDMYLERKKIRFEKTK